MTVRISGTNTTAAPGFQGGDSDTGIRPGTNEIEFVTGGSVAATFNSSGNLVFPDTQGIDFHNYGTGANVDSNLLDDYEKGTWTPTALSYSGTLTVNSASYIKVGNLVHVNFYVSFSNTTDSASVIIAGLPFTAAGTTAEYSLMAAHSNNSVDSLGMRSQGTVDRLTAVVDNGSTGDSKPSYTTFAQKFIICGGTYIAA